MAKKKIKKEKKNAKRNKIKQNVIQITLLSLAILLIVFFVYEIVGLAINPTASFLIEEGTVTKEESVVGYIIRDEKVIDSKEETGKLVKIKNEGEKVSVGESVFRYEIENEKELNEKIQSLNEQIQNAMEGETNFLSSDIKAIDKQIETKILGIQSKNNIQEIKENKNDIDGYITKKAKISGELSPAGSYISGLIEERTKIQYELYNSSKYEDAPIGGIVSYRIDELEDSLTPENFENITSDYLKKLNLTTGQVIPTSEAKGKVINNFECYIAITTNSEEAKNSQIGDKVSIRLQTNEIVNGEILSIKEEKNSRLVILKITKGVEQLANYRKISLDIIWWEKEGLRVPNTSIIYENGLSYVIRTKSGLLNKILVKIVKENDNYCIITNYKTEELKNMGFSGEEINTMKQIGIYDEILSDPDLEKISKELN